MTITATTTPTIAGGPSRLGAPEAKQFVGTARLTYQPSERRGRTYRLLIGGPRLTAFIDPTEEGFVARSPELDSLGYGSDPVGALANLIEAIREYLEFLAEEQPALAPGVGHHAAYIALLGRPDWEWFAAILASQPATDAA